MPRAHARRKPSLEGSKTAAHAGQARSAPRKHLYRQRKMLEQRQAMLVLLQKVLTRSNYAQAWQDKANCRIRIRGVDDWRTVFKLETIKVVPYYAKYFGTEEPALLDYLRVDSDLNKVSFERSVIGELLTEGFELEALEVEFLNEEQKTWGLCKWYQCHFAYEEPIHELYKSLDASLLYAMFQTEHAGDRQFCLYSSQIGGNSILLHKSIIFHKVILRKPTYKMAKAA